MDLGNRVLDEDVLIFANVDRLKKHMQTQVLFQRYTLLSKAEQLAQRVDAALFRGKHKEDKACNSHISNGSKQGGME